MSARSRRDSAGLLERPVVDADVHVHVPPDEVAPYCNQAYRGRVENVAAYPVDTGSDWYTEDDRIDAADRLETPADVRERVVDGLGIDHPILNLNTGIQKLPTDGLAVDLMRGYNRLLLDRFLDGTGFHGLAEITTQRPSEAAEELDRVGSEDRIVGALIGSTGPDKPLGDPRYDVVYRAAEDNDLPVVFHSNSGPHFRHDFTKQNQGFRNAFGVDTLSHLWSQSLTFTSLVTQGVPEKFPDLDFVFLEAGSVWAPYMMWRLNKEYAMQKPQAPLLETSPERYARRSCYFGTHPLGSPDTPEHLDALTDVLGPESLVFTSNYPYGDAGSAAELADVLGNRFSDGDLDRIAGETPADLFGIDV